jgi:hypothetical protein
MQDRRTNVRDKVFLGGVAEINENATMDCVVRNFSETGACVELDSAAKIPREINLTIARKGRSYLANIIWRHANLVGLAFKTMLTDATGSDLDARLRRSEKKKRKLERRVRQLLGEG